MLWLYILYILIGTATMLFVISVTCVYEEKDLSDYDILLFCLVSMFGGLVWPVTLTWVVILTFAKSLYNKSKAKAEKKLTELEKEQMKLHHEEEKTRARSEIFARGKN